VPPVGGRSSAPAAPVPATRALGSSPGPDCQH